MDITPDFCTFHSIFRKLKDVNGKHEYVHIYTHSNIHTYTYSKTHTYGNEYIYENIHMHITYTHMSLDNFMHIQKKKSQGN